MYTNLLSANVTLTVKDLQNGERVTKHTVCRRRKGINISGRFPNNFSICKITTIKEIFSKLHSIKPSQYILSLGRPTYIAFLLHDCGHRTTQSSDINEVQRTNTGVNRDEGISRYQSDEGFSVKDERRGFRTNREGAQYNKAEDVRVSKEGKYNHIGFRFQRTDCVWESGIGRNRIQPVQTWEEIISPGICFRKSVKDNPWRGIEGWEGKEQGNSGYTIYRRCIEEDTNKHSEISGTHTNGCWILLLGDSGIYRRERIWICNSSTDDTTYKDEVARIEISYIQSSRKIGGSRILLSASWMEKEVPIHSSATYIATGTGDHSTQVIYIRPLSISRISDKLRIKSGRRLVFLQWAGCGRELYKRTKNRFFYEQDTNSQFFSKSSTFEIITVGLRFVPLVSNVMFTGRYTNQNTTMGTQTYSGSPWQIYHPWTSKRTEITERIPKRTMDKTDISQCSKGEIIAKIGRFVSDSCVVSDETTPKYCIFPHYLG